MPQSRGLQRVRQDLVTKQQHRQVCSAALKRTRLMGAGGGEVGLAEVRMGGE